MKLYGVEMLNKKEYDAYETVIDSAKIEGFKPTTESVQLLKDFHEKKITLIEMVKKVQSGEIHV
ncbi:hypothetical protein [Listeria booriae]|uniref:Antitoxin VbhA domain-containing protein n=1 Tax=Listeria booriae TaxID=1552123 RepID=A0A7X0ZW19_9LIST|nr:hypothetical protein [Listeria booriae]MBC2283940.1 hypothetical protein [Listeria booriae]MBC2293366.1 hypothetical protein [Listeria booriae]MBC2305121.1 hypothetical protein [Listeria booriae]MBC2311259.1 hypothetical protein [Listeria booriae]